MEAQRLHILALIFLGGLVGCATDDDAPETSRGDAGFSSVRDASLFPDAGAVFVDAALGDAGASPPPECDPLAQDCPGDKEKCVVELDPSPACAASDALDAERSEACAPGECRAGLACVLETETSTVARCAKICDWQTGIGCDLLGPDFECRARIETTDWGVCRQLAPTCDPWTQAPCASNEACQPFLRRTGAWDFRCRAAGPGEEGARCDGTNAGCARGLACVSDRSGTATCRRICRENADCEEPAQCVGIVDEPPFNYCTE